MKTDIKKHENGGAKSWIKAHLSDIIPVLGLILVLVFFHAVSGGKVFTKTNFNTLFNEAFSLLIVTYLIVSLGLLLIYEILAQKIGLGVSKTIPADVGMIGKFPYSLIILGASALLFYYIYNKTCIACHIRAVGNEELLANALGVNAMNTKYMTFVLAGIFIGITAILQISYANSITTVSSLRSISMIFQPLMGVLIAFAIQEWCNLTLGVFVSQFTLSMMFNALIALGVPSKMQDVVLGVMLIIVMGIALNNKRISGFFERKARRKELMKRA